MGSACQRWRELNEWEELDLDTEVVLFLFDRWVSNVDFALFHSTYPCWLLLEYAFVSSSLASAIVVAVVVYVCVDEDIPPPWQFGPPVKKSPLRPWLEGSIISFLG